MMLFSISQTDGLPCAGSMQWLLPDVMMRLHQSNVNTDIAKSVHFGIYIRPETKLVFQFTHFNPELGNLQLATQNLNNKQAKSTKQKAESLRTHNPTSMFSDHFDLE